jgi:putative ABC transport system permease protein
VQAVGRVDGVRRVAAQRTRSLLLEPTLPPVTLLAREMPDPAQSLPMVGNVAAVSEGAVPIYVSEAIVDLYGARPGSEFAPLSRAFGDARFVVAGVWRDYARQSGAIAMQRADYERLTHDARVNDLQIWLAPGADASRVQQAIRDLAGQEGGMGTALEFASARELREASLRIFDRSFAVTYWLQAVAIGIGLFGVAASFSAQVLARRKEFGLLAHVGLTRGQILRVVAGEGAAWTAIGSVAGLALGLVVAVVLVRVVNPQSFHWTMDLLVPWGRLVLLCLAVVFAGTLTARIAGGAAATRDAVLAVKEDW